MMDTPYSGPSVFRFQPPDVVQVETIGDVSADEMGALLREMGRLAAGRPYFFLLDDISRIGKISPEARKRATEEVDGLLLRGIAVYGASFSQRVIATLLARLLALFGKFGERPVVIVETEAQARAWIAARRQELVDRVGSAPA
jgi:hypothetical protein